jgi:hypothetical protein
VTRIVEPHAGTALFFRPTIQCFGLRAFHVRLEAAQPEQARILASASAHGDGPVRQRRIHCERSQSSVAHGQKNPVVWPSCHRKALAGARGTVAHIIRSGYTLTLARNEKPAVITLKSTFAGRKTNYVEFACIRTTADRHG